MKKAAEVAGNIKGFFGGVNAELKKCTWPTRQELTGSTVVVLVSVAILAVYIGVCDSLLMKLMQLVLR
jgi:preprotein translocase subunit SecE